MRREDDVSDVILVFAGNDKSNGFDLYEIRFIGSAEEAKAYRLRNNCVLDPAIEEWTRRDIKRVWSLINVKFGYASFHQLTTKEPHVGYYVSRAP
jgi:hypothetical protein